MSRELTYNQKVERSIITTYRKTIWNEFVCACKDYNLVNNNDKIAVCISGGKDSTLLAKCMQHLKRISETDFQLEFICMDPGYNRKNRELIEKNCKNLEIPVHFFESDVFSVARKLDEHPCYLCARMRRGYLYSEAQKLGCNKIALGHHMSDVIETTLLGMLYSSQLQAMLPKLSSTNFPGMELIRPLYRVNENNIINWEKYNNLEFLQCACPLSEEYINFNHRNITSKRDEVKEIIKALKETNPQIEWNIFNSLHNVMLDTFPKYKKESKWYVHEGYNKDKLI